MNVYEVWYLNILILFFSGINVDIPSFDTTSYLAYDYAFVGDLSITLSARTSVSDGLMMYVIPAVNTGKISIVFFT